MKMTILSVCLFIAIILSWYPYMENLRNKAYHLLRGSEKYLQADMVYIAKEGFWVTFGQITSSALSLALIIAFANLLPKETYGTYRYILSIAGVLNILTLTGMNSAVSRAVAAGKEEALRSSVRYQIKWNALMLAAFWILGIYYYTNGNLIFAYAFLVLGAFVPLTLAFNTYGAFLEGKKNFKLASIASIVSTILYTLGSFTAIVFFGEVVWLIAAYAITTFISTSLFYLYTLNEFRPRDGEALDTLRYGRELTFINFIAPLATHLDKIVLAHFWGATALAIYAMAMAVPERATSLIKGWLGIGSPNFANKTIKELNALFNKRIAQGLSIGTLATIGYVLLAPYLFKYLLPQYLDAIFYSQILSISFIFAIPNRYISLLFVSQKLSKHILANNLIQSFAKISMFVALGIWGGVFGLIIANVANNFIGMLINIAVWKKAARN